MISSISTHATLSSSPPPHRPPPVTATREDPGLCGAPDVPHEADRNNTTTAAVVVNNNRDDSSSKSIAQDANGIKFKSSSSDTCLPITKIPIPKNPSTVSLTLQGAVAPMMTKAGVSVVSPHQQQSHRSKSSSIGDDEDEDEDHEGYDNRGSSASGAGMRGAAKTVRTSSGSSITVQGDGFGLISVSPCLQDLLDHSDDEAVPLTISYAWTSSASMSSPRLGSMSEIKWNALLYKGILYLNVPEGLVIERSKEAFMNLLEFAEEELDCSQILVCFSKNRSERQSLMRMFMFLGFVLLPPKHELIPMDAAEDSVYMAYELE